MTGAQKKPSAFHQMYESDEQIIEKKKIWLPFRIIIQVIVYGLLVVLAYISYVFPPVGIPAIVILFYNKKRHYALFPFVGVMLLIVTQLLNFFFMLIYS